MTKHKPKSSSSSSPTKGKGKGKDLAKKAPNGYGNKDETFDLKDLPLSFPEFVVPDSSKVVPRFSSVLKRSDSDGIGLEDVDTLQLELEALLSSTVVRKMTMKEEWKIVTNIEKYRGTRNGKRGPHSPGKKDEKSMKKLKLMSGKPINGDSLGKVIGVPKIKSENSVSASFDPLQNEQIRPLPESSSPLLPKNETPNRFWSFVEPYCAPLTNDDIKLLEDLIATHENLSEYYRVPPIGQHYSNKWALEDMENERIKGNGNSEVSNDGSSEKLLKKTEGSKDLSPVLGTLTQRLVAGLMEEKLMTSVEASMESSIKNETEKSVFSSISNTSNHSNRGDSLEDRVRRELEEQGILDPNESAERHQVEDEASDEILTELLRCQTELKAVSAHNVSQLKRLHKAAKEELTRQEWRNKLKEADNEVMEAYKKISLSRSKKKTLTKKEREMASKALKDRELILKKLESV